MKQGLLQITAGTLGPSYSRLMRKGAKAAAANRIMARDAAAFTNNAALKKLIANRLGWTDSAALMKRQVGAIERFGRQVIADGYKHVVLMGMGGSSLCPELFKLVHGHHPGIKSFDVIDSTDPAAVRGIARNLDLTRTLFIVASKSGGTVETRSHEAYFAELLRRQGITRFGRSFVAITDPGSGLQESARRDKYRKVFLNPPDIGGRYSALSFFGLVPGFFAGVDLRAFVDDAVVMQKLLAEREGETNPALAIGALMAAGAAEGRDKLTFVSSKKTGPLVPWIEQLVAESTGKKRKGVVPIEHEPLGALDRYGDDRMFVFLRMANERIAAHAQLKKELAAQGTPIIDIALASPAELGRQFLLWEAATAVAGCLMGINPFDEPNVTESKNNTKAILGAFERSGQFPDQAAQKRWGKLTLVGYDSAVKFSDADMETLDSFLGRFLKDMRPPKYLSLLNYFKADRRSEKALEKIRGIVRDRTGMATLRGYGPRFLHSIGQLYKGGPADGLFVVFVRASYGRLPIPGQVYDFGQLIAAQAIGDSQALIQRRLPTVVMAIDGNPAEGLEIFASALQRILK